LVLASSGVRPIEACAIRVCDINFVSSPVRLHIRAEFTKTKKSRDIFISDETAQWLTEWIEYRFGITLQTLKTKKIDTRISRNLVFQVYDIDICSTTPKSIYIKLIQHFHKVLTDINFDRRKDDMPQNRTISFHSFRRFAKTTISIQAGSDFSEWILGHKKSSYYTVKPETKADIYSTKCMKYLTFLEFSTIEATGRSMEAKIEELEKVNQLMGQKHEEEMKAVDQKINRMMELIKYNPMLAQAKRSALERLANTR
jgi:hypothetical protein